VETKNSKDVLCDVIGEENKYPYWVDMPAFDMNTTEDSHMLVMDFRTEDDYIDFQNKIDQKLTDKSVSIWHPKLVPGTRGRNINNRYQGEAIKNKYPVYVVSKGRWEKRLTSDALFKIGIDHYIVVESSEYEKYAQYVDKKNLLILPQFYLDNYDTCDDLGDTKSKGPGAARNFCWQHSMDNGYDRHWVLDDNIGSFFRLHENKKVTMDTSTTFALCEMFVDRYTNIKLAGMNYSMFAKSNDKGVAPYTLNTRIYSCLLIDNNCSHRWRGRYNEDTDLSLMILKDGDCTFLFNAFLCDKATTQTMCGGNTKEFYSNEGTKPKSKMLEDMHPGVATVSWKFNRWHHQVDYTKFKRNKPILKDGLCLDSCVNDYGMIYVELNSNE